MDKFKDCDYHNDESTKYLDITICKATLHVTNKDLRTECGLWIKSGVRFIVFGPEVSSSRSTKVDCGRSYPF